MSQKRIPLDKCKFLGSRGYIGMLGNKTIHKFLVHFEMLKFGLVFRFQSAKIQRIFVPYVAVIC